MKGCESGMPEETLWDTFFHPPVILARLGMNAHTGDVAEFGCGYGTFTVPAARLVRGVVHAFDIDPDMISATEAKVRQAGLGNVRLYERDILTDGTGLPDASVEFAMLFNILHVEDPAALLREGRRLLVSGGRLGIIHWVYDPATPRGPSMQIRPRPEQCRLWAEAAGLVALTTVPVELPPYHYGWAFRALEPGA